MMPRHHQDQSCILFRPSERSVQPQFLSNHWSVLGLAQALMIMKQLHYSQAPIPQAHPAHESRQQNNHRCQQETRLAHIQKHEHRQF